MNRLLLLLLVGCATPAPGTPATPSTPTAPATPTTPTVPGTIDTGEPEPTDFVVATVPPSTRIVGLPGMELGRTGVHVLPAFGADPALLFLSTLSYPYGSPIEVPEALILGAADLPAGEHLITDVWDGVSGADSWSFVSAGDVNDDGALDVWMGTSLVHGPVLGRDVVTAVDAAAWSLGWGGPAAFGDFDADGDGHEDVMFQQVLRYGPFAGDLGSVEDSNVDPTVASAFEGNYGATVALFDHFGPGLHAISVGGGIYDLLQPRGTTLGWDDAIATLPYDEYEYSNKPVSDVGDLDGDGWRDVLAVGSNLHHELYAGPLQGWAPYLPAPLSFVDVLGPTSTIVEGLDDLDGDGVPELLVLEVPDYFDLATWRWVVLFSPYEGGARVQGLLLGSALEVGHHGYWTLTGAWTVADLDDDGLNDLVSQWVAEDEATAPADRLLAGEIAIWYGDDLRDAYTSAPAAK